MSCVKVTHYRLSPKAYADLDDIWRYTAERWSLIQADRYIDELVKIFETLVQMPFLARELSEFDPPVRIHVFGTHLIIYLINDDHVAVIRLLGAKLDWRKMLNALE